MSALLAARALHESQLLLGGVELTDRFWSKVVESDTGCWEWAGALNSRGYGCWAVGGVSKSVHRLTYMAFVGPIGEGLSIDHTCHNADLTCPGGPCGHRTCCNPAHLEAVTPLVNVHRGRAGLRDACARGHEMTGQNVITKTRSNGRVMRNCRTCQRESHRRWLERTAVPA